ncbi:IS5 family transposase [Candidatus Dependentiae bacterium]|nr:IS5 family transposase [Candidatus Dependentiae bacterium]MBU4387892.1 IS5 family transposase [Candidatus Dependentiae bacterium]
MYRRNDKEQLEFENFHLPFGGHLKSDNRWVKLAKIIPWDELEEKYAGLFSDRMGAPAKTFRMALGALIIKERLNITDEETVEQIRETPYLQYLIGFHEYQDKVPFNPSMMVHFRKRLSPEIMARINDVIINGKLKKDDHDDFNDRNDTEDKEISVNEEEFNSGIMMVDASVAPSDIAYPTDLSLLNKSREKLEEIIDALYEPLKGTAQKPRTYRQKARVAYLRVAKQRKSSQKAIGKAIKQQLQYVKRDLGHVVTLGNLESLSSRLYKNLLVIQEIFRQQQEMYQKNIHSTSDRIVNISQPHVRPIVRGKASAAVEFGAKIMVSRINGYHVLEDISWDNVNEATLLQKQIERYRERMGCYPEAVLADKLYRNRDNITFCKDRNIRLSGPKLGRPGKERQADKRQERADCAMRNAIEGSFGTGKRRYSLARIMMKLRETSETSISLIVLVMNLEKILKDIIINFFNRCFRIQKWYFLKKFRAA